ncbi:LacI family DNA-binding transcriptional regulator [Geminisphaera colitermitum]|uniref:LacI family DNA-binding transcriptional regulator n=1 Tax=Geminisphaera colitermitum TaxID=1148786 RepID=UPI0001964DEE|nr:LacI family DNA-binding transcriptional regulator [Geminisphaera colitermitum]
MAQTQHAVTLTDVAARAGLSRATASMALRDDARIAPATRERVRQAAAALHYQPDPVLAALSSRRWHRRASANLAVLIDERWEPAASTSPPASSWLTACLDGMRTASLRFGYVLSELRLIRDLAAWRHPDRVLAGRGMRGLIVLPFHDEAPPGMPDLDWSRYSVVAVGNPLPGQGWHRVGTDAFAAMGLVCDRLRERGIRRIGLVQNIGTERRLRYEWLGALAKEWHLPPSPPLPGNRARVPRLQIIPPHLPATLDERRFLAWFRRERPEVVVTNDSCVITWLRKAGVRVPEDAGVVLLSRDFSPQTNAAGISQHLDEVGHAAIELMHGLILRGERGTPAVRREMLVHPHWTEGATLRRP